MPDFNALKKLTSILFLLIYLIVGFGASVDCHYCGGQLVGLKICGITLKSACPMQSTHSNCCNNDAHFCKTDNHKTPTVVTVSVSETSLKAPVFLIDTYNFSLPAIDGHTSKYFQPGGVHKQSDCPLFISNCVFRI